MKESIYSGMKYYTEGVIEMNKAERFWDKTASQYDQIEKKDEQTYHQIIQRTKPHLKISDVVLDYGCGTGLIANEIAEDVKEICAIDLSSNMILIAEKKAKERNIANINYAQAIIFDERYKKGSFDVILAFHVLHLMENEHLALQRMNELLKPGGLFISATPCVGEKVVLRSLLYFTGTVGLMPSIKSFKKHTLIDTIEKGSFSIIEADDLKKSSHEFFIVARKL
ncbi:class I SAM-dependent methyltransferase [Paenibacillus sp. NPDC058071]|uniref:class I SAM-dependent methyltransferase n=1 Tax=Paenibacillus sp. NPDC058071 TaxID=3346326 RepID=UPI0036DDFE45